MVKQLFEASPPLEEVVEVPRFDGWVNSESHREMDLPFRNMTHVEIVLCIE